MTSDMFANESRSWREEICGGAVVLRCFVLAEDTLLLDDIKKIIHAAPLRQMATPSGLPMSVDTTSCGSVGWISDTYGYRYAAQDTHSKSQWPQLPQTFLRIAQSAALAAGYENFFPDSCLINRYRVGAKMSLHQDKNEKDFEQPIVSISLGLPATFLFGGLKRSDKTIRVPLTHGDVVVWGGLARRRFHGVLPIKAGIHPLLGKQRINLTFRRAL